MTPPSILPIHAAPTRPYYIEAPAYRRTSAGIRVMHLLCHLLNRSGYDAYLYPTAATNPLWHTPLLTPQLAQQHAQAGRQPITVYPEVVAGNPRNGGSVVRYLLNKPGLIGGDTEFPSSDLIFAYTRLLLPPGEASEHVLFMPPIDNSIFHNKNNPHDHQRKGWLLYPGRHAAALQEHRELAEQCTVITRDWPASPQDMAALFRRSEKVYCFESTAIGLEAVLCGCPAVVLPSPFFNGMPLGIEEFGTHGLAFDDTQQALRGAVAGLSAAQEKYAEAESRFWDQLDCFVRNSQAIPYRPAMALDPTQAVDRSNASILTWLKQRRPSNAQSRLIAQHLESRKSTAPRIDFIVLPGDDSSSSSVTLQNLRDDPYPHLKVYEASSANAAELNALAAQSTADWLCFVHAGSTLTPAGVMPLALELMEAQGCRAAYADEIVYESSGVLSTLLRPDFNLDMLLSWPAGTARHWLFRREIFLDANGFDSTSAQAHEFDLVLRLIEAGGLAGLGHIHEPLFVARAPSLVNNAHEVATLERHLRVRGYDQAVVDTSLPGRYRILYGHAAEPRVSVIIAAVEPSDLMKQCVMSLVELTGYPNYEILLAYCGDAKPDWLDALQQPRIRTLSQPQATNLSSLYNTAAQEAGGEYLVLLSESSKVLQEGWIDALLNHALRPEVGIVGGKVLAPNGTINRAGVVLGLHGPAGHPFVGEGVHAPGYMHRLQIDQNYSAVTGAYLMVGRSTFEEVGGMDEDALATAYGDVDLCLKVGKTGRLVVWTPHAVMQLQAVDGMQPAQIPAPAVAQDAMYRKWLPEISRDAAYNQNLSLAGKDFELETASDLNWNPLPWHPLPTVLALASDRPRSSHYRILHPAVACSAAGVADVRLSQHHWLPAEMERLRPDVWVVQSQIQDTQIELLQRQSRLTRAFKVAEIDDYLPHLPPTHPYRASLPDDVEGALRRSLALVDRVVVPSHALADALRLLHSDIRVAPNRLPPIWWHDVKSARQRGLRPRIGCAASQANDLALIAEVVKLLANDVEWIFLGYCPPTLRKYAHEVHDSVSIDQYARKLASLDLDLAVAPLEDNLFNACKGNLRVLELGACGYPVIASDIEAYRAGDLPITLVKNRTEHWLEAIRSHLADLEAAARAGDRLKTDIHRDWMLAGQHVHEWLANWLPQQTRLIGK